MSSSGKIGLWTLLIVVVAACSLWILGGKQHKYSTGLEINASPSTVFAFLTDAPSQIKWNTGLDEVGQFAPIIKTNNRTRVVKTPRVVTLAGGKKVKYDDQVIRFERNQKLTIQSTNHHRVVTSIFQLEPRDEKTFLTFRVLSASVGVGRLLSPLSKDETQTRIDNDIRKLKALVESSAPLLPPTADESADDSPTDSPTFNFSN
jgi:hypothetical protein